MLDRAEQKCQAFGANIDLELADMLDLYVHAGRHHCCKLYPAVHPAYAAYGTGKKTL